MSHVVISYQCATHAFRSNTSINDATTWIGEMSVKGWELKALSSTISPTTQIVGSQRTDIWTECFVAIMQRPIQTADASQPWKYPS